MLDWNDYNFYYVCRRTRGSDLALCLNLKFLIMWGDSFIALLTGSAEFTPNPQSEQESLLLLLCLACSALIMLCASSGKAEWQESGQAGKRENSPPFGRRKTYRTGAGARNRGRALELLAWLTHTLERVHAHSTNPWGQVLSMAACLNCGSSIWLSIDFRFRSIRSP